MESGDEIKNKEKKVSLIIILRIELVLRIFAAVGTLGSAVCIATSTQTQTLQFLQFRAQFNDFPAFRLLLIANCVGCGYLVFSLPFSVFHLLRRKMPKITRIFLHIFDMVMLVVLNSGASAAVSILYLAHQGNNTANWLPICPRFTHFCYRITASLVASFFSILIFILTIITSVIYFY